jgi:hypothetical protein
MLQTFKFKPVLSSKDDSAKLAVNGFAIVSAINPHEAHILVRDAYAIAGEKHPETPKLRWVFSEQLKEQHRDSRVIDTKISFKKKTL